jgi:hypothetical protein
MSTLRVAVSGYCVWISYTKNECIAYPSASTVHCIPSLGSDLCSVLMTAMSAGTDVAMTGDDTV